MINTISNVKYINKFKPYKTITSFKGLSQDTFERTQNTKGNQIGLKSMDNNKNKGITELLPDFYKKAETTPTIMNGLLFYIADYAKGDINAKFFSENFLESFPNLIRRIDFGKDGKEYSESYAPEIRLIKETNSICSAFFEAKLTEKELNTAIEKELNLYINTEHKRTKHFIK